MFNLIKTSSDSADFRTLVALLDADLQVKDGAEHAFFAQFNKLDKIHHVIVAYKDDVPVGCGAVKHYTADTAEIKRMFVHEQYRGQGIAKQILGELEVWSGKLGYSACILETGIKQIEAVGLYQACGYKVIPNYGQYTNVGSSICMLKEL